MPLFIAALWGALIEIAGTLVGKVLVSLGIGYAVYSGVDTSITWAKSYLLSSLQGLPADAIGIASTLKVGVFISMVFSAFVVRMTLQGLAGGSVKRMVQK
jgi:hypothetical protein